MKQTGSLSFELEIEELTEKPVRVMLTATEEEQKTLKARFGLKEMRALTAIVEVYRRGSDKAVLLAGHIKADLAQQCVATLKPVDEQVDDTFELLLVAKDIAEQWDAEGRCLDEAYPDYDEHDGQRVPVGEVVAQSLSILMDPYPRMPGSDLDVKGKGISANEDLLEKPNPFAVLKTLKKDT